ncbi:MAG: OmpA family protein [Lentimicrobium sp.]|jgi:peptidoglycan-associated lipoprotein|nr:OmpA family protein [Lentimicrobium sp.]
MKKYFVLIILASSMLLPWKYSFAQDKLIEKGDASVKMLQYHAALETYLKAWDKMDKNSYKKQQLAIKIADCYFETRNHIEAVVWYKKIADAKITEKNPELWNRLGLALLRTHQPAEAEMWFNKRLQQDPENAIALKGLEIIAFQKKNHPNYPFEVVNLTTINSVANDFGLAFSQEDHKEIIFSSNRKGSAGKQMEQWTGGSFSDLYSARFDGNSWSHITNVDEAEVVNTETNEGSPAFNGRYTTMYFTRCLKGSTEITYCEILQSDRKRNGWSKPQVVLAEAGANVGHPWVSADELTIYFASNRPGGFGGKDIWMAQRAARHRNFESPQNLGKVINTPLDEVFPFVWGDSVLFFASEGHPGFGGLDIFKSNIQDTTFTKAVNLHQPINSVGDDFNFVPDDASSGLLSSNRPGSIGGDDLYSYARFPLYFDLRGVASNENTSLPIPETMVTLFDQNQTEITQVFSDLAGAYHIDSSFLSENQDYTIKFEKKDHFAVVKQLSTRGFLSDQSFVIDAVLAPIPEKPIVLPEIRYELDRWDLLPQYKDSLQLLVTIMKDNPGLIIELRSHTDPRASDEYNDELSQKRAQTVVDYLVSTGIDPERLKAKGYGKKVPRIVEKNISVDGYLFEKGVELTEAYMNRLTPKQKQEAAFSLSRRTEFRVLARNFIPKELPATNQIEPIVDSLQNRVLYESSMHGKPYLSIIVFENALMAEWRSDQKISSISAAKVFDLLINNSITKENIKAKNVEEAIKYGFQRGEAVLIAEKLEIGEKVIKNCEFLIVPDLEVEARFGQDIINKSKPYRIESDINTIIFE